jgi:hypothetical protein
MKSKKKKTALPTEKYEKMMELFKNGLLQLENDKSISEVLRKKLLKPSLHCFIGGYR